MDQDQRPVASEVRSPAPRPGYVAAKIAQVIWLIIVLILILLAIRVVFALIGANLDNAFASFIYNVTEPFVLPFRGLLQVGEVQYGVSRFEFETLVAMFVYLMVGWGITAAVKVLSR